jgi:hypothetical protein
MNIQKGGKSWGRIMNPQKIVVTVEFRPIKTVEDKLLWF